jgi:formate-dependent nitrite reductase membrane component NrfD
MTDYRVAKGEAQEDQVTAAIEKFTAQVPSSAFLALALASMAASLGLQAAKKQHEALFIGQWAAPFLILGIYNKLVKLHGSDGATGGGSIQPS